MLPISCLSILGMIYFYVKYRRLLKNLVKPHKEELNEENINDIIVSERMGSNGK